MRIAYISLHWPRTLTSGVGKKIQEQLAAWQAAGHTARLFMHTSHHEPASDLLAADIFEYAASGLWRTEMERIRAIRRLLEAVEDFQPDVIYFRYGIYVYPAHRLTRIAPVVEEINTNDLIQHEELGRIYSLYNVLTRGLLLRRVGGLICVSRELAASPAFASYGRPTRVIANGINLSRFNPLPAPANQRPRLVFIGNPGNSWHGLDKLVLLAKSFPDLAIDIIGYNRLPEYEPLPVNITVHGYLGRDKYEMILATADAAISSLALHRTGLEEASPLKSREYLAYGLPLVMGYIDTDLSDLNVDFLLRIPNKENNILTHGGMIRDFAYQMCGRRVDMGVIAPRIDIHHKEADRLAFFEKIAFD